MLRSAAVISIAGLLLSIQPSADLHSIFAHADREPQVTRSANGMEMIDAPNTEVVLLRINSDGSAERACVNSEKAAREFLNDTTKSSKQR